MERIVQWIVCLNKLEQETVYQLAFESKKQCKIRKMSWIEDIGPS